MTGQPMVAPLRLAWRKHWQRLSGLPAGLRWHPPGRRLRGLRLAYQTVFLLLFLFLLALTIESMIGSLPVTLFLRLDPLTALSTALAGGTLYADLALALATVLLTLLLGRVFCSWLCPLGALNALAGRLTAPRRTLAQWMAANRWRRLYAFKYLLLVALLAATVWGANLAGLFDPIPLTVRSVAESFYPALFSAWPAWPGGGFPLAWLLGAIFLAILLLNRMVPRFYCRVLCPLGALLGLLSRFSVFRIHRDRSRCTDCGLCTAVCPAAAEPQGRLLAGECFVCFNCVAACPADALRYRLLPPADAAQDMVDLGKRQTLAAMAGGLLTVPLLRADEHVAADMIAKRYDSHLIRPPGALAEEAFLAACIKCGACIQVCPTRVLKPSWLQAGPEGLWTPAADFRLGYCDPRCDACGRVCPTGAIRRFSLEERLGSADRPALRMGTAAFDRGRCLPWAHATPCSKCEEHCPTSPKAIWLQPRTQTRRDGLKVTVAKPHIDLDRCIGCGSCQWVCPISEPAVQVCNAGESRSTRKRLRLSN